MIGAIAGGVAGANMSRGGGGYCSGPGGGSGWSSGLKTVGVLLGLGLSAFGIRSCVESQESDKIAALTPLVDSRLEYFTAELASLGRPAEEFRSVAGTAQQDADQALLDQLEKCSHALGLLRNMLEARLDPSMKTDFALRSPRVLVNDFPMYADIPLSREYLQQLRNCREACLRTFQETIVSLEGDVGNANRECAALFADAHRSLNVLREHAAEGSLSFDEQFLTLDKFGNKRVVAVSDPYFEAESSVRLLQAALRERD